MNASTHGYRRARRLARPGFSLLEITLVLVIIGLLLAGAAVAIGPALGRAQVRTTKVSMETIKKQVEAFQLENKRLPASLDELVPDYLEPGRQLDGWENDFYYAAGQPGAFPPFDLVSAGPDLLFETEDDLSIWELELEGSN